MDFTDLQGWAQASKTIIDIFKSTRDMLPKGKEREEVDKRIEAAEGIMQRADAKLAKELGYLLHKCTFPPQIMLRVEAEKAYVCPGCGHKNKDQVIRAERQPRRDIA